MKKTIRELVELCCDYRKDDFEFNYNHVEKWINQFNESIRKEVLVGTLHILKNSYVSKEHLLEFYSQVVEYINRNFDNRNIILLDDQCHGNSQTEMCSIFNDFIKGNDIQLGDEFGKKLYLYLDDFIFTGTTINRDIERLCKELEVPKEDIFVAVMASHTRADYWLSEINGFNIGYIHCYNNHKKSNQTSQDIYWPKESTTPVIEQYLKLLDEQHANDRFENNDVLFRPNHSSSTDLFLSEDNRDLIEREFFCHGIELINNANNPNARMKPLGYDNKKSLGFGATFVSFRNCPNNCPLVLWYGETNEILRSKLPDNPLSKWYPLFPRKTNH